MGEASMGRSLPRGTEPRAGRRAASRHVLLACCLVAAAPVGLFAQGTDNVRTYWVPTRTFKIPFSIGNDPYITAVLLHVSENGQDYRSAGEPVAPTQRQFLFKADRDGTYSFIVQTRDQGGALTPSDFRGVRPNIRIHVDTQKPIIRLEAAKETAKQQGWPVAIQWDIQDDNFEDVRAYYRSTREGQWFQILDLPRQAKGVHGWRPN